MKEKLSVFLKGMLMGICDLIPGISGGTIAFITGIYERLINAVKSFSFETFKNKEYKKLDLGFLLILFFGIGSALFFGSGIVSFLLENYFIYTMSFFIGLILASCFIIFENIKNHDFNRIVFGFFGLFVGVLLAFLSPVEVVSPSYLYVFFGGFIGISAMFLPGISGAFILLIMGLYEFVIGALHDFSKINYLIVFGFGALLGVFIISRVISYLFKKDRCRVLYFLLGLVAGALSVPVKRVFEIGFSNGDLIFMIVLFFVGICLVLKFHRGLNKITNK